MKKHSTMLLVALGALAPSLAQAEAGRTLVGVVPTGQMHVHLRAPLVSDVDKTTPIVGGRVELTEGPGSDEFGKTFVLTRATLRFGDLDIDTSLASGHMRTIGADLAHSVTLVGSPVSPGVFSFFVSPQEITFHEAATVDGQPSEGYDRPTQDVVGSIDMNAGVFHATIVLPRHHDIDCPVIGCGSVDGTLTIDLTAAFSGDVDGDGVPDFRDNCVRYANPSQEPVPVPMVTAPDEITFDGCGSWPIAAAATDVCNGWPTTLTNNAPSWFGAGTTPVSWYGQVEGHGGVTVVEHVTVVDRTPPQFDAGVPPVTFPACRHLPLTPPHVADDCGGTVALQDDAPYVVQPGQTVNVTWTAKDAAGNVATAVQRVTGGPDATPPTILTVPRPITTDVCAAPVLAPPQAVDDCIAPLTISNDAPATFRLGQTTVTWTVKDAWGNAATATQLVTVTPDRTPPRFLVQGALPSITTPYGVQPVLTPPAVADNCGGPVTVTTNAAGVVFEPGQTPITWTATDQAGNAATIGQLVIMADRPGWPGDGPGGPAGGDGN